MYLSDFCGSSLVDRGSIREQYSAQRAANRSKNEIKSIALLLFATYSDIRQFSELTYKISNQENVLSKQTWRAVFVDKLG